MILHLLSLLMTVVTAQLELPELIYISYEKTTHFNVKGTVISAQDSTFLKISLQENDFNQFNKCAMKFNVGQGLRLEFDDCDVDNYCESVTHHSKSGDEDAFRNFLENLIFRQVGTSVSCTFDFELEGFETEKVTIKATDDSEAFALSLSGNSGDTTSFEYRPTMKLPQLELGDRLEVEVNLQYCGSLSAIHFTGKRTDFDLIAFSFDDSDFKRLRRLKVVQDNDNNIKYDMNDLNEIFFSQLYFVMQPDENGECYLSFQFVLTGDDTYIYRYQAVGLPRPQDDDQEASKNNQGLISGTIGAFAVVLILTAVGFTLYKKKTFNSPVVGLNENENEDDVSSKVDHYFTSL